MPARDIQSWQCLDRDRAQLSPVFFVAISKLASGLGNLLLPILPRAAYRAGRQDNVDAMSTTTTKDQSPATAGQSPTLEALRALLETHRSSQRAAARAAAAQESVLAWRERIELWRAAPTVRHATRCGVLASSDALRAKTRDEAQDAAARVCEDDDLPLEDRLIHALDDFFEPSFDPAASAGHVAADLV